MSSIKEIWEELYNGTPMPDEFQPIIKLFTVWTDRKYNKELKTYRKQVGKLQKQIDELKKNIVLKKKKPIKKNIIKPPMGTVIVTVYNNGYLIHGSTYNCREVIYKYTRNFSKEYGGWIIPRVLTVSEKHKLISSLTEISGRIIPQIKQTDLLFDSSVLEFTQKKNSTNKYKNMYEREHSVDEMKISKNMLFEDDDKPSKKIKKKKIHINLINIL